MFIRTIASALCLLLVVPVAATANASRSIGVPGHRAASKTGSVTFAIKISRKPSTSAAIRRTRPLYVSPSTESLTLLVDGTDPASFNLTSPPSCYADHYTYECRVAVHVTPGVHTFTVKTYDGLNSTGNLLSENETGPVNVAATGTTYVGLALNGVVTGIGFFPDLPVPEIGISEPITLHAVAYDADNNTIIGSASFDAPIELSSNPPGILTLPTSASSPADVSALTALYPGTDVRAIVVHASVLGKPIGQTVLTPMPRTTAKLYVEPTDESRILVYRTANLRLPFGTVFVRNAPDLVPDPIAGMVYAYDFDETRDVGFDLTTLVRGASFAVPGFYNFGLGIADGSTGTLYYETISDDLSSSSIVSIDPKNGYRIATAAPSSDFGPLALDSSAHRLYLLRAGSGASVQGSAPIAIDVYALQNKILSLVDVISLPTLPLAYPTIDVDPATGKLYLTSSGSVYVVSTKAGHALLETIPNVGAFAVAVDSPHKRLYVAESNAFAHGARSNVSVYATDAGNRRVGGVDVPFSYPVGAIAVVP